MSEFRQYSDAVERAINSGAVAWASAWLDYRGLGIDESHVPELLSVFRDLDAEEESNEDGVSSWRRVHAWRAIAKLAVPSAIEAFCDALDAAVEIEDDLFLDDFVRAMPLFGPAAIPHVAFVLNRPHRPVDARVCCAEALVEIGHAHPDARAQVISILHDALERFRENPGEVIDFLIYGLVALRAAESLPLIERAFEHGEVDPEYCGDIEEIRAEIVSPMVPRSTPAAISGAPTNEAGDGVAYDADDDSLRDDDAPPLSPFQQALAEEKRAKKLAKKLKKGR